MFAHGYGSYEYLVLNDTTEITDSYVKEIVYTLAEEYNYSDKYRGVDYEIVDNPPEKWLEREIERLTRIIKYSSTQIEEYSKLLKEK